MIDHLIASPACLAAWESSKNIAPPAATAPVTRVGKIKVWLDKLVSVNALYGFSRGCECRSHYLEQSLHAEHLATTPVCLSAWRKAYGPYAPLDPDV